LEYKAVINGESQMIFFRTAQKSRELFCFVLVFSFLLSAIAPSPLNAQILSQTTSINSNETVALSNDNPSDIVNKIQLIDKKFRVEKLDVKGGAELITIFVKLNTDSPNNNQQEVPLVSVLRDTLGDKIPENDRLRYVWMLTYTKPTFGQKLAAAIPFLYTRTVNKNKVGKDEPPPVIDLNPTDKTMWNKAFWILFQNLVLDDFGVAVKAVSRHYRRNLGDHRKVAIARALAVLSLYEEAQGEKVLSDLEMQDLQARMLLTDSLLGSFMNSENLYRVYQKNLVKIRDLRGHNWELLRQCSEAQGLYFEPLTMPDGSATHALVWVAQEDLANNKNRKFNSRFLNIKNPFDDKRVENWKGYSETRWFDSENRIVDPDTEGATPKRMIPLALYGLDYPKIPILLVDFRNHSNPRKREMSKRILNDLTKNVLSISRFGNLPYFLGRYVYDYVTGRRGMDINQASRLRSYSQLKLLLSLNESINPDLREEIEDNVENVALNPMENDLEAEIKIAQQQYENLIAYAKRSDGLAKKIDEDRREEMVRLRHSSKKRMLFALGHLLSFGIYTKREENTPELFAQMDMRRRLDYHERYLREVARLTAKVEIDSNVAAVRRSLQFIAQNGTDAQGKTAQAIAKLFSKTDIEEMKQLCLTSLYRINNSTAKKELLALYENEKLDAHWRDICAQYLRLAVKEEQKISSDSLKAITKAIGSY
jgi:hypothetical protein